jgi:putative phosphoesterase
VWDGPHPGRQGCAPRAPGGAALSVSEGHPRISDRLIHEDIKDKEHRMRIGIISDIHDNLWVLEEALAPLKQCDLLLCLGDLCSPFTMIAIAEGFAGPIHVVWGNNDGDRVHLQNSVQKLGRVTFYGEFGELTVDGRAVAFTHWPDLARALAAGGQYALVCYGHNHRRNVEPVGETLLVNPGEVMGRFGVRSVAIYDTASAQAELIEI